MPRTEACDSLAAYNKRRRPPMNAFRHHLNPDEPRVLEASLGFAHQVARTADNLAADRPRPTLDREHQDGRYVLANEPSAPLGTE
ncbi:hypothetical protein [Streptomyces canus]|uniref:hypothetical protein n=1 Tax=Streptomyces canus TaxID=58343 RepID=UPI0033A7926A